VLNEPYRFDFPALAEVDIELSLRLRGGFVEILSANALLDFAFAFLPSPRVLVAVGVHENLM
jgi:hypothetical protein